MKNTPSITLRCQRCGNPLTGRQRRWCSVECGVAGYAMTHRAERTAAQNKWRENKRRLAKGQPKVLTPLESRVADLEVAFMLVKAAQKPESKKP